MQQQASPVNLDLDLLLATWIMDHHLVLQTKLLPFFERMMQSCSAEKNKVLWINDSIINHSIIELGSFVTGTKVLSRRFNKFKVSLLIESFTEYPS